jgi:hypothetical protein
MHYLGPVDVNEDFVDSLWDRVSDIGGLHSIGDAVSREVLGKVMFGSAAVFKGPGWVIRMDLCDGYAELHPMAFGPTLFQYANEILSEIASLPLFADKPIRCIIPESLRGAKRLARMAGMTEVSKMTRMLSGIPIACSVFERR